jgi:hypothetical protein
MDEASRKYFGVGLRCLLPRITQASLRLQYFFQEYVLSMLARLCPKRVIRGQGSILYWNIRPLSRDGCLDTHPSCFFGSEPCGTSTAVS